MLRPPPGIALGVVGSVQHGTEAGFVPVLHRIECNLQLEPLGIAVGGRAVGLEPLGVEPLGYSRWGEWPLVYSRRSRRDKKSSAQRGEEAMGIYRLDGHI
jgi:hypothetical protein